MNESAADFEQRLKQLKPASADELRPDVFYQAGWNAGQSQTPVRRQERGRRRAVTTFGTGLLCGLLVSAGVTVWQLSMNGVGGTAATVTQAADKVESGVVDESVRDHGDADVPVAVTASENDWRHLVADLSPWGTARTEGGGQTPLAARPLSPAARYHWSSLVVAEPEARHRDESGDAAGTWSEESQLRSFPATDRVFEELL